MGRHYGAEMFCGLDSLLQDLPWDLLTESIGGASTSDVPVAMTATTLGLLVDKGGVLSNFTNEKYHEMASHLQCSQC
ncbi:hypothetical protein P7K49_016218 [Saguinus oedipus]|uniref:Uncharacterized protein n=1 Tax=Saguinus oedipus TaxID=9490 RepID=A0ABQ9VCS6_SAGOE|nr:hypothetical protein P7K49_016218 [Saguinus oedipus]